MMSFSKKLKRILSKQKPKVENRICANFWCKAHYEVTEDKLEDDFEKYKQCKKCLSFSEDLSGGVVDNGMREYEGDRFDPEPQEVMYKEYRGNDLFNNNSGNLGHLGNKGQGRR